MIKICTKCYKPKLLSEYYVNKRRDRPSNLSSMCRECYKEYYRKVYHRLTPEEKYERNLKRKK